MEIERLRKELNELLENVVDHSQRYSENRPIPSLEISFVLSKINKMQEGLTILKYLLEQQELAHKSSSKKQVVFKKMEDEDDDWGEEEGVIQPAIEPEPVEENKTITEEQELQVKPVANIEQIPINKLVDALTLNDRYLYANELFGKDMTAFNELVKVIDNSTSYEEAKAAIAGLNKEWDEESEHVLSFFSLVERRFM